MNFTYFKFLFITTIKKKPVWITWLLFLFTASAFLLILPGVARMNVLQVWANTTMAICQTFLGMTVALFTAILGIHVFKDGMEEGTELIIISKPISRFKIVLTKFLLFGAFCLMVNISSLLITVFTIFLPVTEPKFYWRLILSMFIGNLVCFGVFGSIAILLTVKFAKIGVIITNIIISLIFLIYQCLTLFVFQIPIRSLSDHGMSAPSYIIAQRDTQTGKYTEDEVVCFKTDVAKQMLQVPEAERNTSKTWQDTISYWQNVICGNDPTKILNVTDWAGQVSLTYLTAGLDEYSYRQAYRMFAISRFYTYDLVSPASPEITGGVENKKTLPWVYTTVKEHVIKDPEIGEELYVFVLPSEFAFSGIGTSGTTRLRGYQDQIPIGFYVKTGEALSSKDLYFEADQWAKYSKPFNLICDKLFNFEYYKDCITDKKILDDPARWSDAWMTNNACLNRYYNLLWSCLTGHSADKEYFNNDFLKDYPMSYFDINTVTDLNERFLQFKYFTYYRVLEEQQECFNSVPSTDEEKLAKQIASNLPWTYLYETIFKLQHSDSNWFMCWNGDTEGELPPLLEPNTQTIDFTLMRDTRVALEEICDEEVEQGIITREQADQIIVDSAYSKFWRTSSMFKYVSDVHEEFLFDSLTTPKRSATFHGKSYMVSGDWRSYWQTLLTPVGQNMQWFFYTTKTTVEYWIFAVIWGSLALMAFAGGAVLYNKYDVK